MEEATIEVAGMHVNPEVHPHTPHIDELIVQANQQLSHPESLPPPSFFPEIDALKALNLDYNPKFVILRRQAEKYATSKKAGTHGALHPEKSEKWVDVLYSALMLALTELMFVKETEHQAQYLDRIFAWFAEKTRFTQAIPRVKRDLEVARPPSLIVPLRQDNSMQARRDRLFLKKLDEVAPIEARSPSKSPLLPKVVDRTKTFRSATRERTDPDEDLDKAYLEKVGTWRRRELSEYRSRRVSEKIVEEWSLRRAKREEQYISRVERNSARIRLASDRHLTETSLSPINPSPGRNDSQISYYDFRREAVIPITSRSMSKSPIQEASTRIERLRVKSGLKLPEKGKESEGKRWEKGSLSLFGDSETFRTPLSVSPHPPTSPPLLLPPHLTQIRRALATSQVPCNYNTLSTGLHPPSPLPSVSPDFLPQGGEYLLVNPFSKLGRKKKKGKKGKRKKK